MNKSHPLLLSSTLHHCLFQNTPTHPRTHKHIHMFIHKHTVQIHTGLYVASFAPHRDSDQFPLCCAAESVFSRVLHLLIMQCAAPYVLNLQQTKFCLKMEPFYIIIIHTNIYLFNFYFILEITYIFLFYFRIKFSSLWAFKVHLYRKQHTQKKL